MKVNCNNRQVKVTLKGVEQRIHKVCDQMTLLDTKIQNLRLRYKRSRQTPGSPLTQSLDMQLNVLQSMYNAYYQYAARQTQKLMILYDPEVQNV